ncbi:MAG: DNA polymerase III subunit delta' [Peptostreptococcales bacterium]
MSFEEILGQDNVIKRLKKSIKDKSIFHAYIFEGPEGVGKKISAFHFAKAMFCTSGTGDSCEACSSCRKMNHGNYSDYYIIAPEDKNILDAQLEEIQKIIAKKPIEGKGAVIMIDKAESMTVRAQNRILKTLEDPIGDTVFILITDNASSLLDTIQSRCITIKFKNIDKKIIKKYLIKEYDLEEQKAAMIAAFSAGSIGKSKKLYESEEFLNFRESGINLAQRLGNLEERDYDDVLKIFEESKGSFIELADILEYWYRDIAIIKLNGDKEIITNIDYLSDIIRKSNAIELKKCIQIIELLEQAKRDYKMNINYNLLIKNMMIKIQEV